MVDVASISGGPSPTNNTQRHPTLQAANDHSLWLGAPHLRCDLRPRWAHLENGGLACQFSNSHPRRLLSILVRGNEGGRRKERIWMLTQGARSWNPRNSCHGPCVCVSAISAASRIAPLEEVLQGWHRAGGWRWGKGHKTLSRPPPCPGHPGGRKGRVWETKFTVPLPQPGYN